MSVRLPFCLTADEVDAPRGWAVMRIDEAYEQLPVGRRYDKRTVCDGGTVPVIDQSLRGTFGYHNGDPGVVASRDNPVATFANHTCAMRLMRSPFSVIQNVFPLVGRPGVCETDFLYYATNGRQQTEEYKGHHPAWRQSYFAVPTLEVQRRIADIFVGIDELIENNRRRVEVLEEMARAIYREWFVHFRFPGHEAATFVDSDLGLIPEGWDAGVIGDLGDVRTGATPPTKESDLYGDSDSDSVPFLTPSDMTGSRFVETARSLSRNGVRRFEGRMVPAGSVCFTCIGSIGKMAVASESLLTNQQINSVAPTPGYASGFVFQHLRDRIDFVVSITGGAATPIVNKSTFGAVEVVLPHSGVLAAFGRVDVHIGNLIGSLTSQNRALRDTRDLLLPKLVTGQIDVSDLDLDAVVERAVG